MNEQKSTERHEAKVHTAPSGRRYVDIDETIRRRLDSIESQPPPKAALCGGCGHNNVSALGICQQLINVLNSDTCNHRCTFPAPVEAPWQVVSWGYENATITDGVTNIEIKDNAYQRPLDQGGRPKKLAAKVAAALNGLSTRAPVEASAVACTWTEDADGNWDTSCENKYIIVEGTPSENEMKFCTFCGLQIEEAVNRYEPE